MGRGGWQSHEGNCVFGQSSELGIIRDNAHKLDSGHDGRPGSVDSGHLSFLDLGEKTSGLVIQTSCEGRIVGASSIGDDWWKDILDENLEGSVGIDFSLWPHNLNLVLILPHPITQGLGHRISTSKIDLHLLMQPQMLGKGSDLPISSEHNVGFGL